MERFSRCLGAGLVAAAVIATTGAEVRAAQLIHADGRRETVEAPRRGGDGRWSHEKEGRRVLAPADVVAVVDDSGKSIETIAELSTADASPEVEAALASVADSKNGQWLTAADTLVAHRSRAVHDALVSLTSSSEKELRRRGVVLLARLLTKESALAAARAVTTEKDGGIRREGGSALFSVREILVRCDSAEVFAAGLAHSDRDLRVVFALIAAPVGGDTALAVLRDDGLTHSDHHFREDAALTLGRQGDAAGEKILISMLSRTRMPGIDDPELMAELLIAEQVEICDVLGRLGTEKGRTALEKATKSRHEAVRAAARKALAPQGAESLSRSADVERVRPSGSR